MKQKAHEKPERESGADTELSGQTAARIPRAKAHFNFSALVSQGLKALLPRLKSGAPTLALSPGKPHAGGPTGRRWVVGSLRLHQIVFAIASRGMRAISFVPSGGVMGNALAVHRLHFAFTITFHYIFPQLTMGLALLIFILKTLALRTGNQHYARAARFWGRIFGISFALGVVTGIPMEFQFGTSWAQFSKSAGGVIGQTLAMEGVFSFFLESSFLGLF